MSDKELLAGLNILIADDNSVNRTLLSTLAASLGAQCITVENGAQALARALDDEYDCIILDLNMPELNGYETAQALTQLSSCPPLVAFTADTSLEILEETLRTGFATVMYKPVDTTRLATVILSACKRAVPDSLSGDGVVVPTTTASPVVYDLEAALKLTGGNRDLAQELFSMLRRDLSEKTAELARTPLTATDQHIDIAHKIHGAASHCHTEALRIAAGTLETALRKHHDLASLEKLRDEMLQRIDEVLQLPDPFAS